MLWCSELGLGHRLFPEPLGDLLPLPGLEPVPVVRVTASDTAVSAVSLIWSRPTNRTTVNRPSGAATPCPVGSTFDDLTASNGPDPIKAVRLFVHTEPGSGSPRSLASMEGGSLIGGISLDRMGNSRDAICFDDLTCPGSHVLRCDSVGGGQCHGNGADFLPLEQTVTVGKATVDTILGNDGPTGEPGRETIIFNTKVVYAGASETSSAAGASHLNPRLVSLFSAHSAKVGFGGLIGSLQFDERASFAWRHRVTLVWSTSGVPFVEFKLQRAFDGVSFVDTATIAATGATTYEYVDEVRGRPAPKIFYRLIGLDAGGVQSQALIAMDWAPARHRF